MSNERWHDPLHVVDSRRASKVAMELIKAGADGVYLFSFFTSREGGENAYDPPFAALRDLGMLNR
jgi:hypothetical protein